MGPRRLHWYRTSPGLQNELPHMGTVKVPRAREAPNHARHSKVTGGPSQLAKPRGLFFSLREQRSEPASCAEAPLEAIMPLEAP